MAEVRVAFAGFGAAGRAAARILRGWEGDPKLPQIRIVGIATQSHGCVGKFYDPGLG